MAEISASIVTYHNSPEMVAHLIRRFRGGGEERKLYVVDNSSNDALRTVAEEAGAEYHFTGKNVGFGTAHNIAIRKALHSSKYHLVLNPDVDFDDDVIPTLQQFMDENPQVGLVMPKVVYPDGGDQNLCKRLPTPFDVFARRFIPGTVKKMLKRRIDSYVCKDVDLTHVTFIPYISGCFMFLRCESLLRSGLFDERFFMYFEDTDLTRRIAREYETVMCPFVLVRHDHGQGSYRDIRLLWVHIIAGFRYFTKYGWIWDAERKEMNSRIIKPLIIK